LFLILAERIPIVMIPRLIFLLLVFTITTPGQGQVDYRPMQQVLEKGIVDSMFVFGKWNKNGKTEIRVKYLGQVVTKTGRIFRIMNATWLWGLSPRATSRVLIFNEMNQYLGNYRVTMISDLPDRLENGRLIFTNQDDPDCDSKLVTKINFTTGLPKAFFLKCKGSSGDIYTFSSE